MAEASSHQIRAVLLEIVAARTPRSQMGPHLSTDTILNEAQRQLGATNNLPFEQAVLTEFYDLFRSGVLSWGLNLANPNPPHFHVTDRGRTVLSNLDRDPHNPAGYFKHLDSVARLDDISMSYVIEGVACFVAGLYKAAAVMIGCSAERLVIELRDAIVARLAKLARPVPADMNDWRARTMSNAVYDFLDAEKARFQRELREAFEAHWPSLTHQFRIARNEAGHPVSVDPVCESAVHASLLLFPELVRLQNQLIQWVANELK